MAYLDDVYAVVQIQPTGVETFVRLSQNENGRQMYFAIQGGELPSGSTATISGTKPDGVVYSASATISGNTVTVNEDIQLTAVAGAWPAKLRILNGGQVIATGRIRFVIDADPVAPGSVPSDSELEGLVAEAAEYAEAAKNAAYYGSPLVASTVAGMTDHTRVYVYTGSESGYINGNWYYWNGSAWTSGGVYNAQGISTDPTLTIAGKAADAKATGDRLTAAEGDLADVKSDLEHLFTAEAKEALLNCFRHVSWLDHDSDYFTALKDALEPVTYPNITAVFSPGTTKIYTDMTVDSLKQYLTVTYYETAESAGVVLSNNDYTLSGTLVDGVNSILAIYGSLTTTFLVTAIDYYNQYEWKWLASGESSVSKISGHASVSTTTPSKIVINTSLANRRAFVVNKAKGTAYQYYNTGNVGLGVYPIPIPHDAIKATAVIDPSARIIYGRVIKFDTTTSTYSDVSGQVWRAGTTEWTFTADDNQYLILASAFANQDQTYDPEPNSVTVTFTK